jgi:hypothetical protein
MDEMTDPVALRELDEAEPVAERIQAHRLAVDGDDGSEIEPFGQIAVMEMDAFQQHAVLATARGRDKRSGDGAQEKTRTSTPFRALAPEASASTSSATWA